MMMIVILIIKIII